MKSGLYKTLCALLAALMLATFAGCSLREGKAKEADPDAVAVRVGDEYVITRGEVQEAYDYFLQYYTYMGMSAPGTDAEIESMQDNAIAGLVSQKIQLYQAKQMGLVTDELVRGAEEQAGSEIEAYLEEFRANARSENAADVETRALEIFQEQLTIAEMDMDVEGFRAYLTDYYGDQRTISALEEKVKSDVSVSDEEVQAYYEELLATQKSSYDAEPARYLDEAEEYQKGGGDPILYAPQGYVRVRTITIVPEDELSDEYTALRAELDELEAEFGKKALEALAAQYVAGSDQVPNLVGSSVENALELLSGYTEKKVRFDELYETYIKDARAKADEAHAKLESGAAFTDVLKEYGEDEMYVTYPSFVDTGLLMLREGDETWSEELASAVLALEANREASHAAPYSEVLCIDDVFYIVELVGDEPAGERPLSGVYDDIKRAALAEKAEEHWYAMLEAWENDTSIAVYYEDVYRSIGK